MRALIDQGAIVYVCGDGGRMEPDVKRTLVAMYDEAFVASPRPTIATCWTCGRAAEPRPGTRPRAAPHQAGGDRAAGLHGGAVRRGAALRADALGLGLCRGLCRGGDGRRAGRLVCRRRPVPPAARPADPAHRHHSAQPPAHRRQARRASSRPTSWRPSRSRRGWARSISPPSSPTGCPIASAARRWRPSCCACCRKALGADRAVRPARLHRQARS